MLQMKYICGIYNHWKNFRVILKVVCLINLVLVVYASSTNILLDQDNVLHILLLNNCRKQQLHITIAKYISKYLYYPVKYRIIIGSDRSNVIL